MSDCHVDPTVDWLAYATNRRKELNRQIERAATRLEENRRLPEPVVEAPPPRPAIPPSIFDKLARHVPNWKTVMMDVCEIHGVKMADIFADKRQRKFNYARQEAYYRLRYEAGLSLLDISMKMKRDHSSVINGIRKHAHRLEKGLAQCTTENS
jgi:chromosomal replication initiation ATPase DnaA